MYIFQSTERSLIPKTYGQYTVIGQKLGSGAFGEIYLAADKQGNEVALKIEKASIKNPQLYHEYKALKILNDTKTAQDKGIVQMFDYFSQQKENVLILEPLGVSLQSLFKKFDKQFPPETILIIGLQILDRIQYIHEKGFLHRDIKPQNFLIGRDPEGHKIYMIDFGLAKRYENKFGAHIPYKDNKSLTGTVRYASVNTQLGVQQGRRDDLEGLLYMLIYFYRGNLPWQNMEAKDKKEKYQKILQKKITTPIEQLCYNSPVQILNTLQYVQKLYFDSAPDYSYIRNQFLEALSLLKIQGTPKLCWISNV